MDDWITTGERPLPFFVTPFARSVSGSSSNDDDEEDDDEEDDDEDEDPDAEKSEEELRAELREVRASLKKANGQSAKRRKSLREREREIEELRKPKPKKKGDEDEDGPDLDTIRHEARTEGSKEGIAKAKRFAARADLLAAGVNPARVTKAVGLLDLDDMDLDDDGLDGSEEAIEDLRKEWPELFTKPKRRRASTSGPADRGGDDDERRESRRSTKTASQRAADQLLNRK